MPDLTISQNLRLTGTPAGEVRRHLRELELDVDFDEQAVDVPLPLLRMLDLARALARDPQLLILDEITAALPADLAERVFDVMRRQKESGRSALFITHRLREVIAHCDRATVLRDGGDVGTLVPREGGEEKIVEFMLGEEVARAAGVAEATPERERIELPAGPTALEVRALQVGETLSDVSFALRPGRSSGSPRSRRRARTSSSTSSRSAEADGRGDPRPRRRAARAAPLRRDPRGRRARPRRPAAGPAAAAPDRREHRGATLQQPAPVGPVGVRDERRRVQ